MPETRERRRSALRSRILDAARQTLTEEGFEALSMRRLGERLDYTPSAIYRHFEDKGALLQALVDTDYAAFAEAMTPEPSADPVERLRRAGEQYVEFGLTHPDQYRLLFLRPPRGSDVPLSDRPCAPVGDVSHDRYAALRQMVADCLESGRFRRDRGDADLIAQSLWAMLHGVVSLHLIRASQPWVDWRPARDAAALLIDTMLKGLTTPEAQST